MKHLAMFEDVHEGQGPAAKWGGPRHRRGIRRALRTVQREQVANAGNTVDEWLGRTGLVQA